MERLFGIVLGNFDIAAEARHILAECSEQIKVCAVGYINGMQIHDPRDRTLFRLC